MFLRLLIAYKNVIRATEDRCLASVYIILLVGKGSLSFSSMASLKRHDTLARDYLKASFYFFEVHLKQQNYPQVPIEYVSLLLKSRK